MNSKAKFPAHKHRMNDGLLKALDHFATPSFSSPFDHVLTVVGKDRHERYWSVHDACRMAHEVLGTEHLNLLKLRCLQDGLKAMGFDSVYEHIMGEKLP
jgi:hypothetical protein